MGTWSIERYVCNNSWTLLQIEFLMVLKGQLSWIWTITKNIEYKMHERTPRRMRQQLGGGLCEIWCRGRRSIKQFCEYK